MKTLLLFLLLPLLAAGAEEGVSKDEIRRTIEHMQQLARESQAHADAVSKENNGLRSDLEEASAALLQANSATAAAQTEVNALTDDRNKLAVDVAYWRQKHSEAVAKLWWWRLWGWAAIALSTLGAVVFWLVKHGARLALPV